MKVIRGKELEDFPAQQLAVLSSGYRQVWLDIGTGDGLFIYQAARANPEILCIGLEPAWENAAQASAKALRKPAKGGASNVLFVQGAVESPPSELGSLAARIWINYPWGSLLRAVSVPEPVVLANIRSLACGQAELEVNLNLAVFSDERQRQTLALPKLDCGYIDKVLAPAFEQAGFRLFEQKSTGADPALRSSWAGQLVRGSGRETLVLRFRTVE